MNAVEQIVGREPRKREGIADFQLPIVDFIAPSGQTLTLDALLGESVMQLIRETGSHFDLDEESALRLMNDVLTRPLFAHLATASEHGPRESPVWFLWEDGAIWIIGNRKTDSFPARIARDPRCALGIVDFNVSTGLVQHVGFRGQARLETHDANRMKRVLIRYMGEPTRWDSRFLKILSDTDYIFVRLEPDTLVVRDQSYSVNVNDRI